MENTLAMLKQEENDNYCRRCHRKLKDEKSKQLGFGKICYLKYIKSTQHNNYLFDIDNIKGE